MIVTIILFMDVETEAHNLKSNDKIDIFFYNVISL